MNPLVVEDSQAEDQAKVFKTGFQAKYLDPIHRRILLDRQGQIFGAVYLPQISAQEEPANEIQENQKLDNLVEMCEKPLLKIKTVFPFVLFTNEVIIDIHKVSIVYGNFFASKQIHSVLVKDVSDVVVETNPFFATLKIVDIGYTDNTIDINYLKRSDGNLARRVIQGLVMAHKHGIDLTKVNRKDLTKKLESLGANEKGDLL